MEIKFFNRELSWIEFNARILYNALRKDLPLMERIQFLSIVSSNFDEFFQVRVASVKGLYQSDPYETDVSGLTAETVLQQISARCHQIVKIQHDCLMNEIIPELEKNNLCYTLPKDWTKNQKNAIVEYFKKDVFPLLTPLRTDSREFFHISNLREYVGFLLKTKKEAKQEELCFSANKDEPKIVFMQIPSGIDRIVWLGSEENKEDKQKKQFTLLEDVIKYCADIIFAGFDVEDSIIFKVARDADFSVDEDSDGDFIEEMEKVLQKRQSSYVVQLICNTKSKVILDFLMKKLNLQESDVYNVSGIFNPSVLLGLRNTDEGQNLSFKKWHHYYPESFTKKTSMFDVIDQKDILLHVPYESYDPVVKFIEEAAIDKNVLSIKMTLYRTGNNSPIIKALEKAAANGKQVCVLVELKARFDEERNIAWATELEKAGVTVVYGFVNLKVHAKILMVIRKDEDTIKRYVHLSTGNYNPKTATLYSDLSLFTSNQEIAKDATVFFNLITGYSSGLSMKHLVIAPISLKDKILAMIQREIDNSTKEKSGLIIAKMNSLTHDEVINALYKASSKGVKVLLNVRGICMLVPGVEGMSENIKVVSIVDRYLEHSRIFYFKNNGKEELYLSSADWMTRNLERRVELMFPVLDKDIFNEVKEILNTYFEDNYSSHELEQNGNWKPSYSEKNKHFRSQEVLYKKYKRKFDSNMDIKKETFIVRR